MPSSWICRYLLGKEESPLDHSDHRCDMHTNLGEEKDFTAARNPIQRGSTFERVTEQASDMDQMCRLVIL